MGEADGAKKTALAQASEDTMGGRVHVRWDETAQATPHGQIVFFAEFLATAGVFDRWVQACPLRYSSPNASRPCDVLRTLMLGILAGSKRYAHIAASARRRGGRQGFGPARHGQRRLGAPCTGGDGARGQRTLDAHGAGSQRARGLGPTMSAGHGRHDQTAVRPPARPTSSG